MAYEVVMPYHLHMPSYFLETFTEYPYFHSRRVPETECIALAVAYASILFLQTESERERM